MLKNIKIKYLVLRLDDDDNVFCDTCYYTMHKGIKDDHEILLRQETISPLLLETHCQH